MDVYALTWMALITFFIVLFNFVLWFWKRSYKIKALDLKGRERLRRKTYKNLLLSRVRLTMLLKQSSPRRNLAITERLVPMDAPEPSSDSLREIRDFLVLKDVNPHFEREIYRIEYTEENYQQILEALEGLAWALNESAQIEAV